MDLNLYMLNNFLPRPTLFWVKSAGPLSSCLMINAKNTEKIGSIEKTEDSSAFSMSLIRKFRASIAEQLPDKYFSIYDSYFDSFKKQLKEIEKYCGNDSSKEESYRLVRSIEWHNEYFIKNKKQLIKRNNSQ